LGDGDTLEAAAIEQASCTLNDRFLYFGAVTGGVRREPLLGDGVEYGAKRV